MQIGSVPPTYTSSAHAAQIAPPQGTPPQVSAAGDRDGDKDGGASAASDSNDHGKQVNVVA